MDWRIVVPVLCLIGILHVPGNAAQANNSTTATQATTQAASPTMNQTANTATTQTASPAVNQTANTATTQTASPAVNQTANTATTQTASPAVNQTANTATTQTASQAVNQTANTATTQTASPAVNQTANTATTQTAKSTDAPTTTAPAKVAQVNLAFSINQDFSENLNNLSDPKTIELANKITDEFTQVYKRRFTNFFRMRIRKFSKGSVVVDSVLEFDTTNATSPNETETKTILVEAINNGSLSFSVDNTSISASAVPENATTTANPTTTTQATTVSAATPLTEYNITFKMNEVFTSDLSDMTSAGAIKLAKNITTELDGYFKVSFPNFNRTLVLRFRNGSIDTDAQIGFNGKTNNPTASALATGLADAVRKGIVKLSIDPKTIKVTDPSGVSANRSPMLASMLTALWMTLASLLLSAVMH